jgi:holin-like protein
MVILLALLSKGIIKLEMIDDIAKFLLDHLAIFFIPPGISLVNNLDLLKEECLPIFTSVFISTVVVIVVTGLTIQFIKKGRPL